MESNDERPKEEKTEVKYIVRIANADLDGHIPVGHALTKIKGIGRSFANLVCILAAVEKGKKTGLLSEDELRRISNVLNNPVEYGVPVWMLNHRKDVYTGMHSHLVGADLRFAQDNDIKKMRRIKCYRGVRHSLGLPVRGQRTRSKFRKNKGKGSLGVKRRAGARSGKV